MKVRLSSSGHNDDRVVEITDEEYVEIRSLERGAFLQDTKRGQEIIKEISSRPAEKDLPVVVIYQ